MQADRADRAHGRSFVSRVEPLVVQAVADFVEQGKKGVAEVAGAVANGDAAITRADLAAEGVDGAIDPAALEVEAQDAGHFAAKGLLAIRAIGAAENGNLGPSPRLANGADQVRQLIPQRREQRNNIQRARARLEILKESVVRFIGVAKTVGFPALEGDDLFQPWPKGGKVGLLTRSAPLLLGQRDQPRQLFDQPARQTCQAVIGAA